MSCPDDNLQLKEKEPCTGPQIEFALIGDYGDDRSAELAVSDLVISWRPEIRIPRISKLNSSISAVKHMTY